MAAAGLKFDSVMSRKTLSVQIQPDLLRSTDPEKIVELLQTVAASESVDVRVSRGHDDGAHINVNFRTDEALKLWTAIQKKLFLENPASANIRQGIVVVCSGRSQWNDYLLLHHYDPSQRLDSLK